MTDAARDKPKAELFAGLPMNAMRDDRLAGRHFRVLMAVAAKDRFSRNGKGCTISQAKIARETGTDDLTLEQEAALLRIVNAINLHDHAIRNNPRVLCGLWRCNERKAKRLLAELVEAGKVEIHGDWITNSRAMEDVSKRRGLRVDAQSTGRRGGIESGKSRRNPLTTKEAGQGNPSTREEKRREEKRREDTPLTPQGGMDAHEDFDEEDLLRGVTLPDEPPKRSKATSCKRKGERIKNSERRDEHQFIPHPATWLNDERWRDDPKVVRPEFRFGRRAGGALL